IGLCQSEDAIADSVEAKMEMADKLVDVVTAEGISKEDLYIDALVYPLATNSLSAAATLEAIGNIMKTFHGVHTTCGLTNVSYGLPNRKLLNRTFLIAALSVGMDSAIMDPTDKGLYSSLKTMLTIMGKDDFCLEYLTAYRNGRLE
ncbi:MAG: methyltetrahydrofolate cobalamin methyltransferase, partial [Candidatus Desulfacyla sp.]